MSPGAPPRMDPRALDRFRAAEPSIQWTEIPSAASGSGRARVATLRDESARIEERRTDSTRELIAESSPVGALVLALEIDRSGPPHELAPVEGGRIPDFPQGALRAVWRSATDPRTDCVSAWKDVVDLARYALR